MPMRRRNSAAVLAVLALITALIAGCSSSNNTSNAPLPDAATLLKQSSDTTKNLKSVHLVLQVTGSIPNLPVHSLTGDLTNTPAVAAKGNANITAFGQTIDADFVVANGNLYAALTPNKWTNFGPAADIYDPSVILDPDKGLANMLANFTNPKSDGRETINGIQTVRVKGTVNGPVIGAIVPEVTNQVPATAWIREDGGHDLVKASVQISPGNTIDMTLADWNKPVAVSPPAGV
ncbi:LppX_LprAFG lipoprotein [Mycobacterium sp.]|uniref:LppX_LprAFG lipoprotein n=1 Tax=Mycobacterium sp. TaxID=1785 RepID=UPI002C0D281C|nr:LppX_LprAFG lipoprotein [Mycobacterium sp.]HME49760.1 LppX_LprAFG lipoprotein [Mycobacterium sp.]